MTPPGSVTHWLKQLEQGELQALQPLWERYFRRLVGLARGRLQGTPRVAADEEDVALSAFASFCRAVEGERFPRLDDRDDLWQVLVLLTVRKAVNLRKYELRVRRGGGRVRPATDCADDSDAAGELLQRVLSEEPTAEFAAQLTEECERLLSRLDSEELRSIALSKMAGYTNEEIAGRQGCVVRTVERRLQVIRSLWEPEESQ
jgi:DNA-directed RNA polymerase specialized sigma24 family protein